MNIRNSYFLRIVCLSLVLGPSGSFAASRETQFMESFCQLAIAKFERTLPSGQAEYATKIKPENPKYTLRFTRKMNGDSLDLVILLNDPSSEPGITLRRVDIRAKRKTTHEEVFRLFGDAIESLKAFAPTKRISLYSPYAEALSDDVSIGLILHGFKRDLHRDPTTGLRSWVRYLYQPGPDSLFSFQYERLTADEIKVNLDNMSEQNYPADRNYFQNMSLTHFLLIAKLGLENQSLLVLKANTFSYFDGSGPNSLLELGDLYFLRNPDNQLTLVHIEPAKGLLDLVSRPTGEALGFNAAHFLAKMPESAGSSEILIPSSHWDLEPYGFVPLPRFHFLGNDYWVLFK